MDSGGRRHGPAQGDHQYPPSSSYATHMSSRGPTVPPQYASNYAPAYPTGDSIQHQTARGAPAPPTHATGPTGPFLRPSMAQGSYSGGISPPLPTSAPAYRGYINSSYSSSAASGSQFVQAVPVAAQQPPQLFQTEQSPSLQGQPAFSMMNPWSMFSSVSKMGQNVQASQEYVSSQVSWFTGGFFLQLFQVDSSYVFKKVVMLILPYLHKYGYERTVDRVEGNATVMAAPRSDLYAPDLYIPMMAMFTYVVLAAGNKFANGLFTPDVVHSMVTWAVVAWGLNFAVLWTVIRLMALQNPPPGVEVFAYSGYVFFNFCVSILCGWLLGRGVGWHAAWLYTSLCMSIFLIRTYKNYIRSSVSQPAMQGGATLTLLAVVLCQRFERAFNTKWVAGRQLDQDSPSSNRRNAHLMLMMGGAQFVLSWLMGTTLHARGKEL